MPAPLLQVNHLQVSFSVNDHTATAVSDISFALHAGEILGIVGESGSGKSVTAMSILRLLPPTATIGGEILFQPPGQEQPSSIIALQDAAMRTLRGRHIGMIFQEPMSSLNPLMTCGRQVMEVIRLHKKVSKAIARAQTLALFQKVQLPDPELILDRYPHELSGGQKQRVMIAMAISCEPQLLIADEPTTALDVTVQKEILQLLQQLQRETGMGMMFITHDLGVVASLAHRVMVMYKGGIVETGEVAAVFGHPVHAYTKSLLACRPPSTVRLRRLPVTADFVDHNVQGQLVEKNTSVPAFLQSLVLDPAIWRVREQQLEKSQHLLEVRNLQTWFPLRRKGWGKPAHFVKAVNDVSFDVRQGEILGLVGESGSGKTTLGRTLLRLIEPTAGTILYKGQNIRQHSAEAMRTLRKDMQLVFQDPYSALNPRLTIGHAIQEPLKVHGMLESDAARKTRVLEWLDRVQLLPSHYDRYPHEFSGGQRQRIVMARALALEPSFVIFDESVSALDVSIQAQVLNLLMDLRNDMGFTCIFISHDLSVVRFVSDRIMVMQQGRIMELGSADQVYHHPQSPYTRQLLAAIPGASL
ncbi:peptide/nickel transport system ATP-binding protein [Chitinophaga costaii]|uniref:Peptide/nickel transport system ATP-binding protein n=1 Tax=Chitinophaga costaii TaxID=1335309 RepID=A0A1C3ZZ01_9BACT|nr:ABC transporter ATP-binding protein [Chitinophaga costaii]PUZ30563.1 ABC transporter ATP-binding protein [Chitinophaga costaii]SCB87541.1 peptide/nickel transport system ATP-binding protein [Chitinophaga costaii]